MMNEYQKKYVNDLNEMIAKQVNDIHHLIDIMTNDVNYLPATVLEVDGTLRIHDAFGRLRYAAGRIDEITRAFVKAINSQDEVEDVANDTGEIETDQ